MTLALIASYAAGLAGRRGSVSRRIAGDARMRQGAHTALDEIDAAGNFKRTEAGFKNTIEAGSRFEPEAGRYHLYVALGCPWAAGTLAALKHKGLDGVVSYSVVHPTWRRTRPDDDGDEHVGWWFRAPNDPPVANELGHGDFECDDALLPDVVNGCKTIRELYEKADDVTGKYSTPVLWCKKEGTIVCNESLDILKLFDSAFDHLCAHPERKLFNMDEMEEAEALNAFIYPMVNNGVYRCGFARTQEAYRAAHSELFASLDRLEAHLGKDSKPFLTGSELTWIDLRLFMTLVRVSLSPRKHAASRSTNPSCAPLTRLCCTCSQQFDPVYVVYFKTSHKRIADFPNLLAFMRRCYALPAVRDATNMRHIKMHYFSSHPSLNTYGVIPEHDGPPLDGV
jgi:putative glutathione S-transferase